MAKKDIFNAVPVKKTHRRKLMEKVHNAEVEPLAKQKRVVTPQQWLFIKELCQEEGKPLSLREAAINAGYAEKGAASVASILTDPKKNPHVVAAIQEYRHELAEKYGTSYERHMQDLLIIRNQALEAKNFSAAVAAEFRRGQALGTIYIDRKEIRHGTIDSMSKEDVKRKLEEIKAMYGGPPPTEILDITPEQIEEPTSMLEAMKDGERSRRPATRQAQKESTELSGSPVGESDQSGNTGLSDSTAAEVRDGGDEGSEERTQGPAVTSPDSLRNEARQPETADIHTD